MAEPERTGARVVVAAGRGTYRVRLKGLSRLGRRVASGPDPDLRGLLERGNLHSLPPRVPPWVEVPRAELPPDRRRRKFEDWVQTRRVRFAALGALLVLVSLYIPLNTEPVISARDEAVRVHGTDALLESGSLRLGLNSTSESSLYQNFLATYRTADEAYYKVQIGSILLYAPFSRLPGAASFYVATAFFATVAIGALFLLARRILDSWWAALLSALIFATSPVFLGWSVTIYDMIPVIGLEMLGAYLLLTRPLTPRHAGFAAPAIGAVCVTRVQDAFIILPLSMVLLIASKRWTSMLTFAGSMAAIVVSLMVFNAISYGGDPFYVPSVGVDFVSSQGDARLAGTGGLLSGYANFLLGTETSVGEFDIVDWLKNLSFHAGYLARSTFAFPLLYLAFLGLLRALFKPYAWTLVGGALGLAALIILLYGNKSENYFGYGEPWVRSSFVRYSLPVFALLAIACGEFGRDLYLAARRWVPDLVLAPFVVVSVMVPGLATAQSWDSYSIERLNTYRRADSQTWEEVELLLRHSDDPLILVGAVAKLVDYDRYDRVVQFSTIPPSAWGDELVPLIEANGGRDAFLLASPADEDFVEFLAASFTLDAVWPVRHLQLMRIDPNTAQ